MTDRQTYSCQGCTRDDLTLTKNGRVRSHAPNGKRVGPDNPACPEGSNFPVQSTEFHTHRFTYADDGNGHSGSFCTVDDCGMAEPDDGPEGSAHLVLPPPPNPFRAPLPGGLHDNAARTVPDRAPTPEPPTEPPAMDARDPLAALESRPAGPMSAADFLDGEHEDEVRENSADTRPFWPARYDGTCYTCGLSFYEGEGIRKVDGGYEAEECCGPEAKERDAVPQADRPKAPARTLPVVNGRYKLPHPETGKPVSASRASKYAEGIADSFALDQWRHRMILVGVVADPEILEKVQSALRDKDPLEVVKAEKQFLNKMAENAMSAAGGDRRSTAGTTSHKYTEEVDAGTRALADVPDDFRRDAAAYVHALRNTGFEPVKGLIERSVYCDELGVSGTFDRVLRCVRTTDVLDLNGRKVTIHEGEFVIGDVKTGDNIEHPWLEILIQEAIYANAINENGVAVQDVADGPFRWAPLAEFGVDHVREDVGVVMHVPYGQGVAKFYATDLITGWRGAQICKNNRDFWKIKLPKVPLAEYAVEPDEPAGYSEEPQESYHTPEERDAAMAEILKDVPELCARCKHVDHLGTCDCGCFNGTEMDDSPAEMIVPDSEVDYVNGSLPGILPDAAPATHTGRPAMHSGAEYRPEPPAGPTVMDVYRDRFRAVLTREQANALWREAKDSGLFTPEEIKSLVALVKLPKDRKPQTAVSRPGSSSGGEPVAETSGSRPPAAQREDGPSLSERARLVTTKAEASAVWNEMNAKIKTLPEDERPAAKRYRDKLAAIMKERLATSA